MNKTINSNYEHQTKIRQVLLETLVRFCMTNLWRRPFAFPEEIIKNFYVGTYIGETNEKLKLHLNLEDFGIAVNMTRTNFKN